MPRTYRQAGRIIHLGGIVLKKVQIIAAISGVITFLLVLTMNASENETPVVEIVKRQIVEINADVPPYTEITSDMLTVREVEENSIHPDTILEVEDAVGLVNTITLFTGEPILSSKLNTKDSLAAGLALKVTPGKRAMSIAVSDPGGVANNLRVGNWVDVIVTMTISTPEDAIRKYNQLVIDYPEYFSFVRETGNGSQTSGDGSGKPDSAEQDDRTVYREGAMFLQNIRILAVSDYVTEDFNVMNEFEPYQTVTLELEPLQTMFLDMMESYTDVRLILREQGDHEIVNLPTLKSQDLLNYENVKRFIEMMESTEPFGLLEESQGETN